MSMLRAMAFAMLVSCTLAAATAGRPAPALSALEGVEPGMWQVRAAGEPSHRICVMDPAALTQVRHTGAACARLVIADAANGATVHYSCPGAGWGRTSVRASSRTSVRIDTQGIADNAPFAFVAEARRTGDCAGATHASYVR